MLLKHAERDGKVVRNNNLTVIRVAPPHGALGFVEPRADPKSERFETLTPHVDAQLFLEREGKARRAVIEHNPAMRNSSSSRSVPGESRLGDTSRWRKPFRARNSHIRSSPSPLNSEAVMTKSQECSSRRFNVYALSLWSTRSPKPTGPTR